MRERERVGGDPKEGEREGWRVGERVREGVDGEVKGRMKMIISTNKYI